MASTSKTTLITKLISFFLLIFLHLGCFIFTTQQPKPKKPIKTPTKLITKPRKAISTSWSYLKQIFSKQNNKPTTESPLHTEPRSSSLIQQSLLIPQAPLGKASQFDLVSITDSDATVNNNNTLVVDHPFFPLRNDIFPCTACGEIFQKPNLLELHQSIKHAVTELVDGDSGKNIVNIIFKTGWVTGNDKNAPRITRILKIHNSPKILSRFEEHREFVKSKATSSVRRRDERCIADGNELLRFYCSTFCCDLGQNGNSTICTHPYCSVCGIIRSGFSPKLDGIATLANSWRAHVSIPEDLEREFGFMNVKRAMLVCRVVAGRVGVEDDDVAEVKEEGGYDSIVGRNCCGGSRLEDDELVVFNPRAVLPCFVIVYTVSD